MLTLLLTGAAVALIGWLALRGPPRTNAAAVPRRNAAPRRCATLHRDRPHVVRRSAFRSPPQADGHLCTLSAVEPDRLEFHVEFVRRLAKRVADGQRIGSVGPSGERYASHPGGWLVFADERGEPLQGTVVYKYHWRPMLKRFGLPPPIRIHDCRHTVATVMHEAGYDMKTIEQILGHAPLASRWTCTPTYCPSTRGGRRGCWKRIWTAHGQITDKPRATSRKLLLWPFVQRQDSGLWIR